MAARDIIQAAAGAAGATEANYIEDVFSTYLYTGTGASQTINNGIDLATKGGLVWIKRRNTAANHVLYDTSRGATYRIFSDDILGNNQDTTGLTAFGTSGFTLGASSGVNGSADTHASWTFRKQAKFFDIVTYTGNGTTQNIAHSLGVAPGMIIVKSSSITNDWTVWHRSLTSGYKLALNSSGAANNTVQNNYFGNNSAVVAPTSTQFTIGSNYNLNQSGATYVAYLFADSNSGGFGPAGTDSVVACGGLTGSGTVNLGWEPQFVLFKVSSVADVWKIYDNMRGFSPDGSSKIVKPNLSDSETTDSDVKITSTGFTVSIGGATGIYLAIRRGPMKTPTDATKVFLPSTTAVNTLFSTGITSLDGAFIVNRTTAGGSRSLFSRLTSSLGLDPTSTSAQVNYGTAISWDLNNAFSQSAIGSSVHWLFRRAPGFFDVVCYTGTGSVTSRNHNLGATPELMIIKGRSNSTRPWYVYHKDLGNNGTNDYELTLSSTNGQTTGAQWLVTNRPTATSFTNNIYLGTNGGSETYVAYLFATCPGVSKVGSYTGTGTTKQIDCGFTSGARFVLIKRTDSTGDWYVWDTARGLVSGNDPYLLLNSTAAEVTNTDYIDPYSAGFEISSTAPAEINASGGTYIYLAIA